MHSNDSNGSRVSWARGFMAPLAIVLAMGLALAACPAEAAPFAYVTNSVDNTVSVIDTATNTVVATVAVGTCPAGVAVTPDGTHAYVMNFSDNTVSVIRTATNTVVKTIPVGVSPFGVAVTPDGTKVYVTNSASNIVSVIHRPGNTVVKRSGGTGPNGVAVTPDGTKVYVVNTGSNNVSVIHRPGNTVVATIPVGQTPIAVAVTPDGTHAYVTNYVGSVSVIATATNTVVGLPITVGFVGPFAVAITPDGTHVYVTNSGNERAFIPSNVSVIRTATKMVVKTILAGSLPIGVAVTPDGTHVYVAIEGSNIVSVIARPGNAVVATVPVGHGPGGWPLGHDAFNLQPTPDTS